MDENATTGMEPLPTVLVVDDDPTGRMLVSAWLSGSYRVLQAGDGAAALALLDETDPDIVLLDVVMPGMSGIDACRHIKARGDGAYRPVLLLTADGEQEKRNAGLEAGADDFLSKPIDQRELLLRLRAFGLLRQQDSLIRRQLHELQRLDRLKEDLVALVSHDLLNALSGLMVLMESIQYAGAACTPEDLNTLLSAASRMRETLEDMLRIKQLEDGVLRPTLAPLPLTELLSGAVALVEPSARARSITITTQVNPRAVVMGDAVLLRRSIFNLLQNAVKFSRRGAEVELMARAENGLVEIEVNDRGPGVDAALQPTLFTKYAGLAGQRSRGPSGHGLGLFLVNLVATAHGGDVTVHGREGGGTTFRLTFPHASS